MGYNKPLFTPAEVARHLKLNLLTIYRYIRKGELSAAKFGRTYRIREEDLDEFVERHKV